MVTENLKTGNIETDLTSFPDKGAKPKVREVVSSTPGEQARYPNIAASSKQHHRETVDKALSFARSCYLRFKKQGQREQLEENMDESDLLFRCGLNTGTRTDRAQTKESEEVPTNTDTISTLGFRELRTIVSGQTEVMVPPGELPVEFDPRRGTRGDILEEAKEEAHDQNALLSYTWENNEMGEKIPRILWSTAKYGNHMLLLEWSRRKVTRTVNEIDENGKRRRKRKQVTVEDWPVLYDWDLKDCFFDTQIDDMQMQHCILFRDQLPLSALYARERAKEYANVGKLTNRHLYRGEGDSEQKDYRQENADESIDGESTGNIRRWIVWLQIPVDDDGRWDVRKNIPRWHRLHLAGNLDEDNAEQLVALSLSSNPYDHGEFPGLLVHEMHDDKGAIHMGFLETGAPIYWQHTKNQNQLQDMIDRLVNVPYLMDVGALVTQGRTRHGNPTVFKRPGKEITPAPILNCLNEVLSAKADCERTMDETFNTVQAVRGTPMGSRTSATEYQGAKQAAIKPLVESSRYLANQIFPWWARLCIELWDQFGDPEVTMQLTYRNEVRSITPTKFTSRFRTKITCIDRFEKDTMTKMEADRAVQATLPIFAQYMGRKGIVAFAEDYWGERGLKAVDRYFPDDIDYDAEQTAQSENALILFEGEWDMPEPEENHQAHLPQHEMAERLYSRLPREQQVPENLSILRQHIEMTKTFLQQQQSKTANSMMLGMGQTTAPAPPPSVPGLAGEAGGDELSGMTNETMA